MSIKFTQYLLPDGRKRRVEIDHENFVESIAHQLIALGCVFEIELLMTGVVSMTCEHTVDGEREVLAHELCKNDESIRPAVQCLVGRAAHAARKIYGNEALPEPRRSDVEQCSEGAD